MKATLIISSEYKYNQPSVFIFHEGSYYGCQIYPSFREFPQDVNYWKVATSSDSDRYFILSDVEYTESDFDKIQKLQSSIFANEALLKAYPGWKSRPSYNVRRGKAYQAYLDFVQKEKEEFDLISDYNRPYEKAITAAKNELRALLLSVK